jgi:RNA polymerase-binding transcription factor DksA
MSNTPFRLVDLEQSEADMNAVQSAIEAIDAGTYGTCTVCRKNLTEAVKTNPVLLTCEDHLALV